MKDALGHGSNGKGGSGGKIAKPIPNHPYHHYTDDQLRYIQKDASEAGKSAQEMGDERGVNKYADQVNDASTVLGYRARGGDGPEQSKLATVGGDAAAARALASGSKSEPVPVHNGASGPSNREDVAVRQQARGAPWQVYGKSTGRVYGEYPDKGKGYDNAKVHASEHNRGQR